MKNKNKKKKNNKFLILATVAIALLGATAYALFTDALNIGGSLEGSAEFNLEYTATSTTSPAATSVISSDKKTLTIEALLSAPGETVNITYTITNNGTLSATLKDIVSNHNSNDDLQVDLIDASMIENTVLAPGASTQGTVVVRWKNDSTNQAPTAVAFDVTFNWEQTI